MYRFGQGAALWSPLRLITILNCKALRNKLESRPFFYVFVVSVDYFILPILYVIINVFFLFFLPLGFELAEEENII